MEINPQLKDWEIAKLMFNKNTKLECRMVKHLRKHYSIEKQSDDWSIIYDTTQKDDCGWLIPNEALVKIINCNGSMLADLGF